MFLEWKLKTIRLQTQKKLNKRNLSLYKSMISYMKNSDLRNIEREEILQQIMDMLLQAQQEGKPAEMIIGEDYEFFCQFIINEVEDSKSILYRVLNFIQRYFVWMLIFLGVFTLINSIDSGVISLQITMNQLYLSNIFSLILIPFTRKSKRNALNVPLHPRLPFVRINIHRDSTEYPLGILILIAMFLMFLIRTIFGEDVFQYSFYLHQYLPYILGMVVAIIVVEVYKRIVD
ncbi:hypothetical protein NSA47_11880 [Irregularibacter muris]|uniref:DUF1048 domain-containing protein n=1 Tax=Irregularibacter muris TaxID=1796619 RepID=A0AAE3HHV5_9FIRM|nr:hypothetical protein [Irregularibacter muris]MCR1899675.1 hypothetical protein [Irregularibacter muris]